MSALENQPAKFDYDLMGGVCPIPTTVTKVDCADTSQAKDKKHLSTVCHTCDGRHCDEKHAALVLPEKKN